MEKRYKKYLYCMIKEQPGDSTRVEAANSSEYIQLPWGFDGISLLIDIDNSNSKEVVGDFNPWFGFSSASSKELFCARSHVPGTLSSAYLAHSKVATGGSQINNDRVIEVAISWQDIADNVSKVRHPEGDLLSAINAGLRFGCDPLLLDDGWEKQTYLGGSRQPTGSDKSSLDIVLVDKE